MKLDGRVALITGGGSGMGRATARRLTDEGMQVCVVDIDGDAAAVVNAATSPPEATGTCWVCHPGQAPLAFEFNDVPGPHNVLN